MTKDEFQHEVHDYDTKDVDKAKRDAAAYNERAEGFKVVVVDFGGLGYGLMLDDAARFLQLPIISQ